MLILIFSVSGVVDIREYQSPTIEVRKNEIHITIFLENLGTTPMPDYWIVEIQPRPVGQPLLMFLEDIGLLPLYGIGQQYACDPKYPQNVHRRFFLNAKERMPEFKLISRVNPGTYDLYLISVTKCWAQPPQGNVPVSPYGRGKKIGTIRVIEQIPPACSVGDRKDCRCSAVENAVLCTFCLNDRQWDTVQRVYKWCDSFTEICKDARCIPKPITTTTVPGQTTTTTLGDDIIPQITGGNLLIILILFSLIIIYLFFTK